MLWHALSLWVFGVFASLLFYGVRLIIVIDYPVLMLYVVLFAVYFPFRPLVCVLVIYTAVVDASLALLIGLLW